MENMEYYTQRLQCSDAEKDACLETMKKLYQLRGLIRCNGHLYAEILAEAEPDPFFQTCLMEFAEFFGDSDRLEQLLTQYLVAGNYRGGAFLNAMLISQGMVLLNRYENTAEGTNEYFQNNDWGKVLGNTLRGYFGAEYREKVIETIKQAAHAEQSKREYAFLLPEFDNLMKLSPVQRDWLVRQISEKTLRYALKVGGSAVREFLMEGMENRLEFERDLSDTFNVRSKDVEAAQKEILEKAKEVPECM